MALGTVIIVQSGAGQLVLRYAAGTIIVVGQNSAPLPATVIVPANSTTGIAPGSLSTLSVKGDPFDPTHDIEIDFQVSAARVSGVMRDLTILNAVPAAVVSAQVVSGHADQLLVVFSKPVYLPDVTAFALSYTSGTARTVTGIVSGNATAQVVLQLSGATSTTDVFSLVAAGSSTALDLYPGLSLAAGATPVAAAGVVTSSLVLPVVVDGTIPEVTDTGSGILNLAFAPAGHVNGAQQRVRVPANQRTLTNFPLVPPVRGDALNNTVDQVYVLDRVSGQSFITILTATADNAAPTVSSITANVGATTLVVTFSKAVWVTSVTGLSLSYSVGGPNAVTSVASGNGTTSVTLNLAAASGASDAGTLSYSAANAVYDLAGRNHLAAGSTNFVAAAAWAMPGALHMWRGDGATISAGVASVADVIGSATMTASATHPTQSTLGSNSRVAWQFVTNSYLLSSGGLAETMTSGALFFVIQFSTSTSQFAIINAGETGSPTTFELLARFNGGAGGTIRLDLDNGQTNPLSGGVLNTGTLYDVLVTWNGTSRYIYVNGALVNSITGSALAPNTTADKWALGVLADLATIPASVGGLVMGEARTGNQLLGSVDATSAHNYRTLYYA